MTDTLRAASIDGASRQQVADGCLPRELRFAGLGIGALAVLPRESPPTQRTKPKQTAGQLAKERKSEAHRNDDAAREAETARDRQAALTAARQTEAKARGAATRAAKGLAVAQARWEEAARIGAAMSRLYFRADVRGLGHIPAEGPVLLVGNHSGGILIADTFVFAQAFYDHFGARAAVLSAGP